MIASSARTARAAVAFTLVAPAAIVLAHGFTAILGSALGVQVAECARYASYAAIAIAASALIDAWRPSSTRSPFGAAPWMRSPFGAASIIVLGTALAGGAGASFGGKPGAARAVVPALVIVGAITVVLFHFVASRLDRLVHAATRTRVSNPEILRASLPDVPRPSIPGPNASLLDVVFPSAPGPARNLTRSIVLCAWAILSLLALAETARISTFMANRDVPGAEDSMLQRVAEHDCMGGYVYSAELNRRGHPNVYDTSLYPLGTPNVQVRPESGIPATSTTVRNLAPYVLDNLQYPPPFLLVPRAGLALSNDYLVMRTVWFALQWLGLAAVTFLMATWIGGRPGAIMLALIPLFLVSGPTSLGLQRGQFHPAAWALALGGMLAFEKKKDALGGAMLAFAVLSKIFPGVLGIYLIATKRWRAVAWTLAGGAAWVGLSLVVVGPATFERFVTYQLPRIMSGEAFAWCFERTTCVINNQAPYGLPFKLSSMGYLSDPSPLGHAIATVYPWIVAVLAIWAGLRTAPKGSTGEGGAPARAARARAWTSVALLASLTPYLVPAAYGPFATFWTLMLLAGHVRSRAGALLLAIAWIAAFQMPASPTSDAKMALSIVTALVLLGVNVWTALGTRLDASSAASPLDFDGDPDDSHAPHDHAPNPT